MAEILPFRALHYDPRKIPDLGAVVTQPYDKISPQMQARYYGLSPYNLVRIIRGRTLPDDGPANNVYVRAASDFQAWIQSGVLASEHEPAIYPYHQEYEVPGQRGLRKERRGFIALLRLEDYSARVVHRHEETLSGPKADRLELLKATRAHYGQIFMLYSDPAGVVEGLLAAPAAEQPWERVTDEYGTRHTAWRTAEPKIIAGVTAAMSNKRLVIADGHHRYETASAYRDACRANSSDRNAPHEFVMMTLVNMNSPGLVVLPTHRVVFGVEGFDAEKLTRQLQEFCELKRTTSSGAGLLAELAEMGRGGTAFGVVTAGGRVLARVRADKVDNLLTDVTTLERQLDVVVLHEIVLHRILGISPEAVREQRNVRYFRSADEAVQQVANGANAAFLLNPVPLTVMRDLCYAGRVMPQKSTDFYPKLLSGLTLDDLDQCF